jgi:hypothetical protein
VWRVKSVFIHTLPWTKRAVSIFYQYGNRPLELLIEHERDFLVKCDKCGGLQNATQPEI